MNCPKCKIKLSTDLIGMTPDVKVPRSGDFTLCSACGSILKFSSENELTMPTEDDLNQLKNSPLYGFIKKSQKLVNTWKKWKV